jgi:NADH-quinone oxidoreductase subunit G
VITLIFRLVSKAIDNEFSGNMIDVCPVGALTDKTFRFKSRVWFNKPFNAHRECTHQDVVEKQQYGCLETRFSVTGRKDVYHEVEEFICNSCRFDHKEVTDWVIEGPRNLTKTVINQNNYTRELDTVHIATEEGILKVESKTEKN